MNYVDSPFKGIGALFEKKHPRSKFLQIFLLGNINPILSIKLPNYWLIILFLNAYTLGPIKLLKWSRAAVVHLNFRAESTFPAPVCTVSPGHWVNKADTQ